MLAIARTTLTWSLAVIPHRRQGGYERVFKN
jgi:hypothetical protein